MVGKFGSDFRFELEVNWTEREVRVQEIAEPEPQVQFRVWHKQQSPEHVQTPKPVLRFWHENFPTDATNQA